MIRLSKSAGFSLVELMIVVAIMAILAAIAIPSFMKFSIKSKTSEATSNLAGIRTCQESYKAENDVYYNCAASPAGGGTDSVPDVWVDAGIVGTDAFSDVGFAPDGNVRYIYQVQGAGAVGFISTAISDLDDDGITAAYVVDKGAATYPKPEPDVAALYSGGDDF